MSQGERLECDESVPHIDLPEPFGEDASIEAAAAREAGLAPAADLDRARVVLDAYKNAKGS